MRWGFVDHFKPGSCHQTLLFRNEWVQYADYLACSVCTNQQEILGNECVNEADLVLHGITNEYLLNKFLNTRTCQKSKQNMHLFSSHYAWQFFSCLLVVKKECWDSLKKRTFYRWTMGKKEPVNQVQDISAVVVVVKIGSLMYKVMNIQSTHEHGCHDFLTTSEHKSYLPPVRWDSGSF